MIIDCISDLHGFYPKLEGGDLLIVAGDLTANNRVREYYAFSKWIKSQSYKKKIVIGGNHDTEVQLHEWDEIPIDFEYLCDSGTEFQGLKIWGSPWTKTFEGMNPHCMAFTMDTEEELAEKWAMIPDDIDILVTHSPPMYARDYTTIKDSKIIPGYGSYSLSVRVGRLKPMLHVFGHIHESYGTDKNSATMFINASHVNEHYKPVNQPIRVIL